ncbi:MAG: Maf-like protein [Pigmentiphaga sp.]|nr:Maf-like protein [Pigmentiphaga sp.]
MSRLYLASKSPRRREILTQLGIGHEVLTLPPEAGPDEPQLPGESAEIYVQRTARDKAQRAAAFLEQSPLTRRPILAADTTVILNGRVLGKPVDAQDARAMLHALSGGEHAVHTAVALISHGQLHEDVSRTRVWFRPLSAQDIERYVASGEPFDKAGGYGIQGLASVFISRIDGSFSGVMGLPVFETARLLGKIGIVLP